MSRVKVTITIESDNVHATTIREATGPGRTFVLPVLARAAKAAAADHADEFPVIRDALKVITDALGSVEA